MPKYSQQERPFRLDTKLGGETTLLESFEGRETLSQPYRFALRFLTEKPVDMDGLLGTPAVVTMQKQFTESTLYLHGHLWSVRQRAEGQDGLYAYEAELVPWLRFLELHVHCRIFHKATVQKIVSTIFSDRKLKNFRFDLQSELPTREYCVQYRETDLNFVSRLLEEEGIYYYFKHAYDKHELVLTDRKAALPASPGSAQAQVHTGRGGVGPANPVFEFEDLRQMRAGKVELSDYNFETPKVSLLANLDSAVTGEVFDYPGRYTTKSDGDRYARIRLEEEEVRFSSVSGSSGCAGFRTGHTFQLNGHIQRDLNKQYLLVAIEHAGRNSSYRASATAETASYRNLFQAIPATVQYRPPQISRKALVHGTQTAIVTGPGDEEIYTDKYGRIQVRFFWMTGEDTNSCWVRVAHTWAGKNWGAISIPRVGQEVVVDFLEGDPDRPLVIGSVYNADQMPPYELTGDKTRSGIRSRSSKGGSASNYNEIYFEDLKGQEVLFMQAERDNQVKVKHDRTKDVVNDETIKVGHDRTANVSNNDSLTVGSDRNAKVGKDDSLQAGSNISVIAGKEIKFSSPGGSITIGATGIEIKSPTMIVIQAPMVKIN